MRPSLASLGSFVVFAVAALVLFGFWARGGLGDFYGRAVVWTASPLVRMSSGFRVTRIQNKAGGVGIDVFMQRSGEDPMVLPVQPREQFSGLIPFVALMIATPGLAWATRARGTAIGIVLLFAFHVCLTLLGPFLATPHMPWVNKVIDVTYGFVGLIGYVALPFMLWFWLSGIGERLLQRPLPETGE